jgi:hypothetical protein
MRKANNFSHDYTIDRLTRFLFSKVRCDSEKSRINTIICLRNGNVGVCLSILAIGFSAINPVNC